MFSLVGRSHGFLSVMMRMSSCLKPSLSRRSIREISRPSIRVVSGTAKKVCHGKGVLGAPLSLNRGLDATCSRSQSLIFMRISVRYSFCEATYDERPPLPGAQRKGLWNWHLRPIEFAGQIKRKLRAWQLCATNGSVQRQQHNK
jgi:hypothetical protein